MRIRPVPTFHVLYNKHVKLAAVGYKLVQTGLIRTFTCLLVTYNHNAHWRGEKDVAFCVTNPTFTCKDQCKSNC